MKKIIFPLIAICLLFTSCDKDDNDCSECNRGEHGILVDKTGFDGCGWLIKLDDGTFLEATNLDSFNIELINNQEVEVKYKEISGGSVCMMGKLVKLKCIEVED